MAQQHRDHSDEVRERSLASRREVRIAIAVEIANRCEARAVGRHIVTLGPERAVPIAEQHGDRIRAEVRDRQVGLAIPIQIADRRRDRIRPRDVVALRPERSVSVPQQN